MTYFYYNWKFVPLISFPYFARPFRPPLLPPVCFLYLWARFCLFVHLFCFSDSIYNLNHTVFLFWLISLSIIPSRSIHIITNGKILSFDDRVIFHYIYVPALPYPSIEGHLGGFHILALVNHAEHRDEYTSSNWCLCFLQICIQNWNCWIVILFLIFSRKLHGVSIVTALYFMFL